MSSVTPVVLNLEKKTFNQTAKNTGLTTKDRAVTAVASKCLAECVVCMEVLWDNRAIKAHGWPALPHPGSEKHAMVHTECLMTAFKMNGLCPVCRHPIDKTYLEGSDQGETKEGGGQPASLKSLVAITSSAPPLPKAALPVPSAPPLPKAALPVPSAQRTVWWRGCCGNNTDVLDTHGLAAIEARLAAVEATSRAQQQADLPRQETQGMKPGSPPVVKSHRPTKPRAALQEDLKKVLDKAEVSVDGQKIVCVFDSEIRNLIENYNIDDKRYSEEQRELHRPIEERVKYLKSIDGQEHLLAESYDPEARYLREQYNISFNKQREEKKELKRQINERRVYLGLDVQEETMWGSLDLSNLNLSKLNLDGLSLKCSVLNGTDFSDSILKNCAFTRCRFLNCNLQRTTFINCNFSGEEVSFFKSDMKGAVIDSDCNLEVGTTWNRILNFDLFKVELSMRGAMNVDSVTLGVRGSSLKHPSVPTMWQSESP
jgi:hypothetical protein